MDLSLWKYEGSKFECRLIHAETPYGKFYFRALPGNKIAFEASLKQTDNTYVSSRIYQQTPPWSAIQSTRLISTENIDAASTKLSSDINGTQISFTGNVGLLLDAVQTSQWVKIALTGSNASASRLYILPTISIKQPVTAFNRCRDDLPAMSFEQARTLSLPFAFGQKQLTDTQLSTLADLNSYIRVDASINRILIDGHTDNRGSSIINLTISRQRSEQVSDALQSMGVAKEKLEVRWHGERYPVASNDTKQGQAKNRRVILRLVRDTEKVVPVVASAYTPSNTVAITTETAKVQ